MRPRNPGHSTLLLAVIALALLVPAIVASDGPAGPVGGASLDGDRSPIALSAGASSAASDEANPDAAAASSAGSSAGAAVPVQRDLDTQADSEPGTAFEDAVRPLRELSPGADAIAREREGLISVVVRDLRSGLTYARDGDRPHVLASVIKLPIALAALEWERASGEALPPNYRRWLHNMITLSDNFATVAILEYIGGDETMRAFFSRLGLAHVSRAFIAEDWGESPASALDVAAMFAFLATGEGMAATGEGIAGGEGLDEGVRASVFALLDDVILEQRWGVSAGLAEALPGWTVALKNGWFPVEAGWRVHSAGVVRDERGEARYVMVVLSSEQRLLGYGQDGIHQIVTALYAALAARG